MNDRIAEQHNSIPKGLAAGFIATLVLSMMMVIKSMIGLMPQLDVIAMLSGMLGVSAVIAWVCLLYTSPSPRDRQKSRMPSSA